MGERFDVIVIGAGPAGAMAAKECARQGLKTTLIEKDKTPRSKPCGGGVSLKAVNLIGKKIPKYLVEQYVRGFRLFSPSLDSVEFISEDLIGITTTRDKFDAYLTELAIHQGCEFLDSNGVIDISILDDKAICRLKKGGLIEGRIIIGADGANSITAGKAGMRKKWKKDQIALCLETTIFLDEGEMKNIDSEILEIYFLGIPLGYGWLFPKKSSVSLGIGGCLAYLHQPQKILFDFCETASKLKKIHLKISRFHAHLAPAGGFRRKIVSDHVMLVGDAAGFIDPLTGEGIYYAMKSGLLAATASKEAIEEEDMSASFLETHYSKVCEKAFEKDLQIALAFTYKIHDHFTAFFDLLKNYSGPSWANIARGEITYRVLRRKLLPWLTVRLLNKKLRSFFHIRKEG